MTRLEVVIGSHRDWPLQCWNQGAQTAPAGWASGDIMTAYLYQGQEQSQLMTLAVSWYTAGSTQTGYGQAQVVLTITAAQSATLEQNGVYTWQIWRTPSGSSEATCVGRGQLAALPAAGSDTQTVTPYIQYSDMKALAPWIEYCQDSDSDQEGFYSQRLQSREWMDWMILNCYRGAYVGLFEQHSTMAFEFGYAGWRRSLGPSPSLITYLEDNDLIVRPQIVKACSHYAISLVGLAQVGANNQYASWGAYHRDMAEREAVGITAEIDINGDGIGELFINLSSTNTLFT